MNVELSGDIPRELVGAGYRPPTLGKILAVVCVGLMGGFVAGVLANALPRPFSTAFSVGCVTSVVAYAIWSLWDLRRQERETQRIMREFTAALMEQAAQFRARPSTEGR